MAKEKFVRDKPHVNIGTIGHIEGGDTLGEDRGGGWLRGVWLWSVRLGNRPLLPVPAFVLVLVAVLLVLVAGHLLVLRSRQLDLHESGLGHPADRQPALPTAGQQRLQVGCAIHRLVVDVRDDLVGL